MKKKNKRPILVTGGAGFIGSHVVDELIAMGENVVALDDLSGGFRTNIHANAVFIKGSITNEALVQKIFKRYHFEYVFHLAAYAAERLSHFIKKFNYESNLIGSINLINASVNSGVKYFIFMSSIAVYGTGHAPMTEDLPPSPEDSYGIAKYAVEQELRSVKQMFGMEYIIFRPHNVYGERQNIADKYRNVIGIFMNKIVHDDPLPIFGDGSQKRAFTHIQDIAPIIAHSIYDPKAYNQIFNIGADEPYTIKELAEKVLAVTGGASKVEFLEARNEIKIAYADHLKAKTLLGYKAKIGLSEGLQRMASWVKEHELRSGKEFKGIEITKNLPSFWLT